MTAQQAETEPALSFKETCKRLNISHETLRKLIHTGEIAAFKIGKGRTSDFRITETAIRDYIDSHRVVPRRP